MRPVRVRPALAGMPKTARSLSALGAAPFVFLLAVSSCATATGAAPDVAVVMTPEQIAAANHMRVCDDPTAEVNCHARVLVGPDGKPVPTATPSGLGPAQLLDAYKITSSGSSATVIGIVDAF